MKISLWISGSAAPVDTEKDGGGAVGGNSGGQCGWVEEFWRAGQP